MGLTCPQCGGTNLENVSILYHGGVTNTETAGSSYNFSGKDGSVYSGRSVSRTQLSDKLSPPKITNEAEARKDLQQSLLLGIVILSPMLLGWLFTRNPTTIISIIVIMLLIFLVKLNNLNKAKVIDKKNQPDYDRWMKSVICKTCGHIFQIQ